MTDIVRAFPWLARIRPFSPVVEPLAAGALFLCAVLSVASSGVPGVAVVFVACAGMATARLVPWVSLDCVVAAGIVYAVSGSWLALGWTIFLFAVTLGLVAAHRRSVERWIALGIAVVAASGFGLYTWIGFLSPFAALVGAWMVGTAAGEGLARIRAVQRSEILTEQLGASQLELAVTAERERVAQEVHDVVAHSLAVILAQAEGARALATKRPAAMTDALERIAAQSRSALLDVRGIVDGLTGGDEPPQPTLDDLPELLHGVGEAGVTVRSTSAGDPRELGAAQQAAVYRIVQEGATNAIRHRGRGSALDVVLDWRGPGLSLQIVSSGTGDADPAPGAGRGIPGMAERARIAGGWLAAGADESGDHRITAFVPFLSEAAPVPVPA